MLNPFACDGRMFEAIQSMSPSVWRDSLKVTPKQDLIVWFAGFLVNRNFCRCVSDFHFDESARFITLLTHAFPCEDPMSAFLTNIEGIECYRVLLEQKWFQRFCFKFLKQEVSDSIDDSLIMLIKLSEVFAFMVIFQTNIHDRNSATESLHFIINNGLLGELGTCAMSNICMFANRVCPGDKIFQEFLRNHCEEHETRMSSAGLFAAWNGGMKISNSRYSKNFCHWTECTGKNDRSKMLQCSQCRSVTYCCKPHQRMHWEAHKKFCKAVKSLKDADV